MKHFLIFVTLLIALTAFSVSANAQVFFSNPYDFESTNLYGAFSGAYHNQSYADYYNDGAFTITDFHWWGVPFYDNDNSLISGFDFQIYSHDDASGQPGSLLYSEFITGDANAVSTNDLLNFPIDFEVFKYGFDLTTPFVSNGGHYWFSILAIPASDDLDGFGWALSDGVVFDEDWYFNNPANLLHPVEGDFAYELTGFTDVVPEPATMTLFGLGLLGMAMRRRLRK